MIKTNIISYISARWGDITSPKRLPILDREVSTVLLDELYPTVISDNETTTNVFTAANAIDITYNLKIVKQGRCVTIKGRFKNATAQIISNVVFATITNSEYLPSETTIYFGFGTLGPVSFVLNTNGVLSIVSAMPSSSEIDINFTYFTLN